MEWKEKEEQEEIRAPVFIAVHLLGPTIMNDCFPKHNSPHGPGADGYLP